VIQECHLKFYKSSRNFNSNKITYKEFFGCLKTGFILFSDLFFLVLDPFYFEGRNFLISNPFLTIVSVSDASRGEVQILFGH
jgi:hypothetical protein